MKGKNDVVVQLRGGLGNQLFQYAMAKNLEICTGKRIVFDDLNFRFPFARIDRQQKIQKLLGITIQKKYFLNALLNLLKTTIGRFPRLTVLAKKYLARFIERERERKYHIISDEDFDITEIQNTTAYLIGDFTSVDYHIENFETIHNYIRKRICLKYHEPHNFKIEKSLGIHIRRGDYVTNLKTNSYHGICPDNYYVDSIKFLLQKYSIEEVYLASDSPEMCSSIERSIRALGLRVKKINIGDIETLHFLSHLPYFIGSNSTFSWWIGALSASEMPVFPKNWFKSRIGFSTNCYIPFRHHLVENVLE
jgi:hypothetical protein